jgi:hypothetical protein
MTHAERKSARDPAGAAGRWRAAARRGAAQRCRCATESGRNSESGRLQQYAATPNHQSKVTPNLRPRAGAAAASSFSSFTPPPPPAFSLISHVAQEREAETTAGQPASSREREHRHRAHAAACYRLYCTVLDRQLTHPATPHSLSFSGTPPAWHHPYAGYAALVYCLRLAGPRRGRSV